MDKEELQQKIALYYSKLPPNVQEMFSSMTWLETLRKISLKYGLNDKQIETLGTETTLVLLGIIHLVEYEEKLTSELGLSTDSTDKILMEINESIIESVRPQLALAFEANKNSESDGVEIETKLDARFENLPKEIENIVEESNYQATLYAIAKEYNLNVIDMGILEKAVTDLIAGVIHPDEFEEYLESNLKLPMETVRKIVDDVNEKIFKKIREELIKNTERKKIFANKKIEIEEEKINTDVLNKAGIEIIPEKLELTTTQVPTPARIGTEVKEVHPLLTQKLSSSFQIGAKTTEHSLDNITKAPMPSGVGVQKKIPNVDPYRELPE